MRGVIEWFHRLLGTVRPRRSDDELAAELRIHQELAAERGERVTGAAQAMEALRDQRGLPWLEDVGGDVRHALRTLRRSPGFTAVALLMLTLGIGGTAAIFTIVHGVLLRPLDYTNPEQLMLLTTRSPITPRFGVSPPEYMEFREINQSFSAVGGFRTAELNFNAAERPMRVRAAYVDEHLLDALGVRAAQGRLFAPGETDVVASPPGSAAALPRRRSIGILSHELWQSAFGGAPMVGQPIEVNGVRGEVIGIMPPGVDVMDNRIEVWLPLGLNPANRQNRGNHVLTVVGRLKNGVDAQSAQRELDALMASWAARVGITPGPGAAGHSFGPLSETGGHILQMTPLHEAVVGGAGRPLWLLQAAVVLVLLIACVNLANLTLARAERRQREFAVRRALGARAGRLIRQLVTEGLVLAVAGGALGLLLGGITVKVLMDAYSSTLPRAGDVSLDASVVLFTTAVSTVCGVIFGLAPIAQTRFKALMSRLREGSTSATGAPRDRARRGLVAAEVALAVMLVVGAALLARTVYNLTAVEAGFDRSRLVTFSTTLPGIAYPQAASRRQLHRRVLAELRRQPGIEAVTAMSGLPPLRPADTSDTDIDNYEAPPQGPHENVEYYQFVMDGYFDTMGISIVAGRAFERADAASSGRVAVVNETMARTFWPDRSPLGQRVRPCCGDEIPWYTVIGVAADVRQGGLEQRPGNELYFFAEQPLPSMPETMHVVLRTDLSAGALAPVVERVVRGADAQVPVVGLRDMEAVFADSIRRRTLIARVFGAFAALALVLTLIGTYGVLSYLVAQRRREIGVRLALGADPARVLREVMSRGLAPIVIGVVLGVAGAMTVNRLIQSLLFGVQATDPSTLMTVAVTITVVAAAACWVPAWRASRLDPVAVLRTE